MKNDFVASRIDKAIRVIAAEPELYGKRYFNYHNNEQCCVVGTLISRSEKLNKYKKMILDGFVLNSSGIFSLWLTFGVEIVDCFYSEYGLSYSDLIDLQQINDMICGIDDPAGIRKGKILNYLNKLKEDSLNV